MSGSRLAAGMLTLLLVVLFIVTIQQEQQLAFVLPALVVGILLGSIYVWYGAIPEWMINISNGNITADDDPRNIPPKVYLSVIFTAIGIAVGMFYWFVQ